uniref:Uncharacterized protein n=1 Tax=Oryza punctata TaxID=4537 RepID=A0A0E0LL07_ORYPU
MGHRHRLRLRRTYPLSLNGHERGPRDAVRAGVRRADVPHAGTLPAVVAGHVGGGVRPHLRPLVLHRAAPPPPPAGPGGVRRRRGVRARTGAGALRLLLPPVPPPVPADAVRRPAARRLLAGAVPATRRACARARQRARPRPRRRRRRRLRHLLGLLLHAARLRAPVGEVRGDVEWLLRRGVQVRRPHRQARHALRRHGLLGVLGVRAAGSDRRLAPESDSEHLADRHVLEHGGHRLHDHVRVQRRSEHAGVERDRGRERGWGEERGGGDAEAVGVPGGGVRAAARVRPRPLGGAVQRERRHRGGVRRRDAADDGLHPARLRAGGPLRRRQGMRLAAPRRHDQPRRLLLHRHAARHLLRLQAQVVHQGIMDGFDLRADMPDLHADGDHRPNQMVQDRGRDAGEEGQLCRLIS